MRVPITVAFFVFSASACAHLLSISTGDMRIDGTRAVYDVRMPLYEIAHIRNPAKSLMANLHVLNRGREIRSATSQCREVRTDGAFVCSAEYDFGTAPDDLAVACTFHAVTVPNHVHVLRVVENGRAAQAIFDYTSTRSAIRFEPPSPAEAVWAHASAGMGHVAGTVAQLLFLAALVLAAQSRRELPGLAASFIAGEILAYSVARATGYFPAPRFVEAACALTIAYLAFEILFLPKSRKRWLVTAALGCFHGLYFHALVRAGGYAPPSFFVGVVAAELLVVAAFAFLLRRALALVNALRAVQVAASLLLLFGISWFAVRLTG